jgi:hypothetical protein
MCDGENDKASFYTEREVSTIVLGASDVKNLPR